MIVYAPTPLIVLHFLPYIVSKGKEGDARRPIVVVVKERGPRGEIILLVDSAEENDELTVCASRA